MVALVFQGPRLRITSVLYKPLMVSARALSWASPVLPTDGWMPARCTGWTCIAIPSPNDV